MLKKILLVYFTVACAFCAIAQDSPLSLQFKNPPAGYRPGCYYYWMNDHISEKGVQEDIRAMAEAGIGRMFIGNVGFPESEMFLKQGDARLFSAAWWNITLAAVKAGATYGVNVGFFNSPGWSQSGGPWIKPDQSMRYLESQEMRVDGPGRMVKQFPQSPLFRQVAVMAFPQPAYENENISRYISDVKISAGGIDIRRAFDGDTTTAAAFPANIVQPVTIDITATKPFTARSLVLYSPGSPFSASITLQVKEGNGYKTISAFQYNRTNAALNVGFRPWAPVAVSFPEQHAGEYRLVLTNIRGRAGFSEIRLTGAAMEERYEEKQLAKMFQTPLPLWNEYQWSSQPAVQDKNAVIEPAKVEDITKMVSADGLLKWQAPRGKWVVVRYGMVPTGVTNAPATPEGRGYDVDKMNRQAIADHFDAFISRILKRIPAEDKKAFKYVVADSYETGSQNWTDDFAAAFRKTYGYDPFKWLPVLTGRVVGSRDESDRFLWDLRRLVADKVAYDYVGGLRDFCHKNGLGLWLENYGHWGFPSEFLKYGGQSDEVSGEFWAEGELGNIECRAASSSAHIYGKNTVSGESFTAAGNPYGRYPALLKKRGDWSFTEGINNTILHVYIHQPDERLPGVNAWFGTEFNRHNTWFKQGKAFIDYIRRCNYMLQQGRPVNDVAYFIGEDAPKMTGVTNPPLPEGYQFDYINAEVIEKRLRVKDGRLLLPDGMSYRLLVLPNLESMRPALLQKIRQLINEGATVLGPRPYKSPGLQDFPAADHKVKALSAAVWANADGVNKKSGPFGKGRIMNGLTMEEALAALQVLPDFVSNAGKKILYTHRSTPAYEIYFITNQTDTTINFEPVFRDGRGQPYFYDAVTGSNLKLRNFTLQSNGTKILFRLNRYQSAFIVFNKGEQAIASGGQNLPEPYSTIPLTGKWTVRFDRERQGPANPVVFNELSDWSKNANDSIKNYSGTAVYQTTFRLADLPKDRVYINLNDVKVMATVKLNGKDLGTVWTAPYTVDATNAIKQGDNQLEIEVVNTWVNRLIGDSKLPQSKRNTWCNVNTFKPGMPYEASGLSGPVQLELVKPAF